MNKIKIFVVCACMAILPIFADLAAENTKDNPDTGCNKERFQVEYKQDIDFNTEFRVITDTEAGERYLLATKSNGGIFILPLEEVGG